MARKERISRGKQLRPNYFVFCEGETEVRAKTLQAYGNPSTTVYRLVEQLQELSEDPKL